MHESLVHAKSIMENEDLSSVILFGDEILKSSDRGVKALMDIYRSGRTVRGYRACDKVVGRAAAFLHIYLGACEIYAHVISEPALKLLEENHVAVSCGTVVPGILNRSKTASCPLESAVKDINDPEEALKAIELAIRELMANSSK